MARKGDADARFDKLLRSLGYAVLGLQRAADEGGDQVVRLTDVRFKLDADNGTSVLVVLKGVQGDEKLVAFTGGPNLETAVLSAGGKVRGDSLKWREDRPWQA